VIKSGGRPSGDPSKYDFGTIQSLLDATDPAKVSAAGAAHNSAARIVAQVAHELYRVGTDLATKWEGADAAAAQKALGQLYATANELYWRSEQVGTALQTYGAALPQYKGLKWPPGGASPVEDTARQQAAEKVMRAVNQHIGDAWDTMPDKVRANLPDLQHERDENPYKPAGPNPTGSSGSPGTGGTGGRSGSGRLPHAPRGGEQILPGGPAGGHGTELAGAPPPGGGQVAAFPPAGDPFSPAASSGFPGGGITPGSGAGPFGAGGFAPGRVPGEPLPARPLGNLAAGAASARSARAQAGLMVPGSAPGAGGNEKERRRDVRLTEEPETWAAGDEAVPEVLGAAPRPTRGEETERERTTWLDEQREIWTGEETAVPGTIGDATSRVGKVEEAGETGESEPDILDPERLQELLDALVPDEETPEERPKPPAEPVGLFEGFDAEAAEVNEIGRLLNG
jgi:hypothetical protein